MKRACLLLLIAGCDARPVFSQQQIDQADLGATLRPGFLMGTATSSHQVEGGNVNDWTEWENSAYGDGRPHIKDGTVSGDGAQSFDRFEEDLVLMKTLGSNAYRFSVEWSRLEPEPGVWRDDVADRYLTWVTRLRESGIEPMVTLHHFTLPLWISHDGGWENETTLDHFEAFSARVAAKLGAQVDLWCTLNEPNVAAVQAYLDGIWPPGKQSGKATAEVLARMLEAHARATRQIRAMDTVDANGDGHATRVGIAHHVRIFQPATHSALDTYIAGATDDFSNESIIRAGKTGRIHLVIPGEVEIDRVVPDLAGSFDYLGINYYERDHVRTDLSDPSLSRQYVREGRPRNDLGWDLYPEGLYVFLKRFAQTGWPLYITESGTADASGEQRPGHIRAHVYAIQRAAEEGVDVRGYFHWSLIDNFEWAEGYAPKFGLFRVNFGSPQKTRTPTPAVATFQTIAERIPR